MKIGVIGAMEVEIAALKDSMETARVTERAGMEFCEGRIGGLEVVVVRSGVGKVNAGICVQVLVDLFGVTHVLNTGVAGSLDNNIDIGDIVVSTDAVYHDVDATIFGYAPGEVPQLGVKSFAADEDLRRTAADAVRKAAPQIGVHEGRIVSGDQFIASREVRERIAERFGGACTEMEGAAIAQAAWINRVPFVILRAISDKADESVHVSYDEFEAEAAEHCARIVLYVLNAMAQGPEGGKEPA